jgi:hypothetical protein
MKAVKFAIFSLFTLSFILVSFSVSVFMGKQSEEMRRGEAEARLSVQQVANKKLSVAYDQMGQAREDLAQKLVYEQKRVKKIVSSLNQEKADSSKLQKNLKTANKDLDSMRLDYQTLSQSLEILQQKLIDLGATDYEIDQAVKKGGRTEIELPPVVVNANASQDAKILVVNRDYNFVVIDRGANEGIRLGDFLEIHRGGKVVARVQAEKIYDHFSACSIVEESKKIKVQVDDQVKAA